ncbi:hypothetical protein CHS0354_037996 [Potamilus streckersoni]|uniref:Fibronectin type-III domain-containing protein n=1 Tax=Potamilus streckersoni TaxID=2493646 RepID=A0AAE0WDF8_9BIVA|nr:hypothetical protein CHS0354_037996 [Potamilus streckersoni]
MKTFSMKIMIKLIYLILVTNVSIINGKYQDLLKMEGLLCPTSQCDCQIHETRGYILNCRDKKLTKIPFFSKVNVTFGELTFSTSYDRGSLPSCTPCNRITTVPSGAFTNLKVKRIDLTKNYVSNFSVDAFVGVEDILQELLIEGDGLISIPFSALKKLNHLTFLELWNFRQPFILNNLTWNFTNLTMLELHKIKSLTHIAEDTFQNRFPKLTSLLIDDVPLSYVPVSALSKLTSLTNLTIRNTEIPQIYNKSFTNLNKLKAIEITYNSKLNILDENCFFGLAATLQDLRLEHNSLSAKQIVKVFSVLPMTGLHSLTLSYNQNSDGLNGLPGKTFQKLTRLVYLYLEHTKIKELKADTFYGLEALHTLDLSFNEIKYIQPGLFSFSPTLADLRLNSQSINNEWLNFPTEAIESIKNSLEFLNLEKTLLNSSQIWKIVEKLPKLKELRLSGTNLKSIPDFVFKHSHSLKEVYLAENNISQLSSASFWGLQDTLQKVDLQGNNLTIDKCVFDNFTRLQDILFTWHCDCQLLWLLDIIKRREQHHLEQCSSPEYLKDIFLIDLKVDQLPCPSNYTEHSCPTYNYTMTTTQPSDTTPDATQKTSTEFTKIHLSVISKEAYSITVAWNAFMDWSSITGFVLHYKCLEENILKTKKFHRETIHYTLEDLKPNTHYEICIYMEINKTIDTKSFQCLRENTKKVEVSDSQNLPNSALIGICVGGAIFLILAITITFIVVKYNILKKKTDDQIGGYASVQDVKVSVIPNNYTDLKNLPQPTCLNDRDRVEDYRLAQTNSAPSVLNVGQLLRSTSDPNRPLPATPVLPGPSDTCNVVATSVFYKENTDEIHIDFCK